MKLNLITVFEKKILDSIMSISHKIPTGVIPIEFCSSIFWTKKTLLSRFYFAGTMCTKN